MQFRKGWPVLARLRKLAAVHPALRLRGPGWQFFEASCTTSVHARAVRRSVNEVGGWCGSGTRAVPILTESPGPERMVRM
jgi:hypothetical protein